MIQSIQYKVEEKLYDFLFLRARISCLVVIGTRSNVDRQIHLWQEKFTCFMGIVQLSYLHSQTVVGI